MKQEIFLNDYIMPDRKAKQTCVEILRVVNDFKHRSQISFLLEKYQSLKGFLKNVDFECNIQANGSCKNYNGGRCCCFNCKDNLGFIHIMFEHQIPYYARHFNYKSGFWREGKGCILPHHMRSVTCLTQHCNYTDEGYKYFGRGMSIIRQTLKDIRKEIIERYKRK